MLIYQINQYHHYLDILIKHHDFHRLYKDIELKDSYDLSIVYRQYKPTARQTTINKIRARNSFLLIKISTSRTPLY